MLFGNGRSTNAYRSLRPDRRSFAEAEAFIASERRIWLYVFGADGRQLGRSVGTPENVQFPDRVIALRQRSPLALHQARVVHNHPADPDPNGIATFPPSPTDVAGAVWFGVAEFLIVSGPSSYRIRRPVDENGDEAEAWFVSAAEIEETFNSMLDHRSLGRLDMPDEFVRDDSFRKRRCEAQHDIMVELDQAGWLSYIRELRVRPV